MTHTFLITGGAGFIGRALVNAIAALGHRIVVLDALTYAGHPSTIEGIAGDITLVKGDIRDGALVRELLGTYKPNAVFHLAAESHVDNSIDAPAGFVDTNINGSYTMLESVRRYWEKEGKDTAFRYLHISTDEVYGALGEEGIFTPDSPIAPNSPYSASKAASDMLARAWYKTYGLPVIITRCSNNYGPYQHPEKLIPRMIINATKGEKLPVYGSGMQVRDWIHVDDHASGIIAAFERGKAGEVYLFGGHNEVRNIDVVTNICDTLKASHADIDYHALITHVTDRLGHDFRYAIDDEASIEALGWKRAITDFKRGLEDTIAWYLANRRWVDTMHAHTQEKRSAA